MKILVGATNFYPHIGGIESYTLNLFSLLHKKYSHEISILTLNNCNAPQKESYNGLEIYRLSCFSFPTVNPLFNPIKAFLYLKRGGYDLMISQGRFYYMSLIIALWCKYKHIKHIHIEHNAGFMNHKSIFVQCIAKLYDLTFGKIVLNLADYIVAVSSMVKTFIIKDLHIHKDIKVIYNGIDTLAFPFVYSYQQQKKVLFYGRVMKSKGIFIALDAFKKLDNYRLEVVGVGEDLEGAKIYCQLHNITNVRFSGAKSQSYIIKNINKYAMLIFPSFFSEGLPTILLELGALGLPIITTDAPGVKDIIVHGRDGIVIPQQDREALCHAIKTFRYNQNYTTNLRNKIETSFTISYIADRWEEFFHIL